MQRLIVDMDGVLADIYTQYLNFEESESGIRRSLESLYSKSESQIFKNIDTYLHTKGFFGNAPVIQGSQDALSRLNDLYEVFIVSSATEFPHSFNEKYDWLTQHFPFITWSKWYSAVQNQLSRGIS